ncbi:MAG: hypothetical protein KAH46_10800 [Mycobacterium sp.]|nr:hypothetical protein [Mycobacterium sp.]
MSTAVSFDEYLSTLGRLTGHVDPTASTPEAEAIRTATRCRSPRGCGRRC